MSSGGRELNITSGTSSPHKRPRRLCERRPSNPQITVNKQAPQLMAGAMSSVLQFQSCSSRISPKRSKHILIDPQRIEQRPGGPPSGPERQGGRRNQPPSDHARPPQVAGRSQTYSTSIKKAPTSQPIAFHLLSPLPPTSDCQASNVPPTSTPRCSRPSGTTVP